MHKQAHEWLRDYFNQRAVTILIGQSGAGKGTQIPLLRQMCLDLTGQTLFTSISGDNFREYIPKATPYMQEVLSGTQDSGRLQPSAVAVSYILRKMEEGYHGGPILLDGNPRRTVEAKTLHRIFHEWLGMPIHLLHLHVDDDEARRRLIKRNEDFIAEGKEPRKDSLSEESIKNKLAYYHHRVVPAIKWMGKKGHTVTSIDANKSIESVASDIQTALVKYAYHHCK